MALKKSKNYLIKQILSEKAVGQQASNCYVFEVDKNSNKIEIGKAFKERYGIRSRKINIINIKGKKTRWGRFVGQTKNWKKAVVYLRKGDKIELAKF